jgi:hypothetical protein
MMKVSRMNRGLVVLLVLALAALACGGGSAEPTATRQPRPTQRPQATEVVEDPTEEPEPTEEEEPTEAPEPTDEPAPTEEITEAPFVLADEPYVHPSGAFTVSLPDGWEVDEKDNSIFVVAPDNEAAIEIAYINAGAPLDEAGLDSFIQAIEDNWFATYPNYEVFEPEVQSDGSIGVLKTLDLEEGGTSQTVFSYYWQEGQVVYEQDFWVDTDLYDAYVDGLLAVANSMQTDPDAGALADPYAVTYTFTGPNDLFSFSVPYAWTYTASEGDNSLVDVFTSPDGLTYVENITYDDGEEVSKSEAGAFARFLLQEYYEVDDIVITDDQVQSDGSERLNWYSTALGVDGTSFFETRGTTFLLLTWIVDSAAYDQYFPVWDNLVNSYTIPETEPE